MIPQAMFGLGVPELLIILAVVLLLFGGSRLAGLGKSTGRALKEFKEETKGLKGENENGEITGTTEPPTSQPAPQNPAQQYPTQQYPTQNPAQQYPVQDPTPQYPTQNPAPNDVRKDS